MILDFLDVKQVYYNIITLAIKMSMHDLISDVSYRL